MVTIAKQSGVVLVVSLIMLLVLTLLAVTAINMSTVNLHIVGNMQAKMNAEAATQQVVDEQVISTLGSFNTPAAFTQSQSGYTVTVNTPVCVSSGPSAGWEQQYSINQIAGVRYDNYWIVTASVSGGASGESASITQGVRVEQVLAQCP